jgi:hypothetical protein
MSRSSSRKTLPSRGRPVADSDIRRKRGMRALSAGDRGQSEPFGSCSMLAKRRSKGGGELASQLTQARLTIVVQAFAQRFGDRRGLIDDRTPVDHIHESPRNVGPRAARKQPQRHHRRLAQASWNVDGSRQVSTLEVLGVQPRLPFERGKGAYSTERCHATGSATRRPPA